MRTQNDRVLRVLKARGPEGTDQAMWYAPEDGGPAIARLAARIKDLREAGWNITSHAQEGSKFTLYRLGAYQPNAPIGNPVAPVEPVRDLVRADAKKGVVSEPQLALPF